MDAQSLYYENPLQLEFTALIREKQTLPDGRIGVILDRTYFYPTGGGQEHDTGKIDEAQVIDVFKDEATSAVMHILDRDIAIGTVEAKIDGERRLRHMQHHTAQHLLTQCFVRLFDQETVSANINGYSPSTLDLTLCDLNKGELNRAEDLANQITYEDRQVKAYFVEPDQIHTVPLRRPPSVSEDIRVVEIDGYDYSACGGTHCPTTGTIGAIKILKAEHQNDKTRIHFIAGMQAMEYFRNYFDIVVNLAGQMSVHPQELSEAVQRQTDHLKSAQKELSALRLERSGFEAHDLAKRGEIIGPYRIVLATFENRPVDELRALANEFKEMPGIIALLATHDGQKVSLVVTCAPDTGVSARELLNRQLASLGGRGGGDQTIAQGGGQITPGQIETLFDSTRSIMQEMLP